MRHGIDLAIRTQQRGDQQRAAGEILGVAHGGGGDIDPLAGMDEGRQIGGDHDGGDILGLQLRGQRLGVDAKPAQHADQGLLGEDRILQAVAGVVEADHQAVADQLVVANALNVRDVLDPGLRAGIAGAQAGWAAGAG